MWGCSGVGERHPVCKYQLVGTFATGLVAMLTFAVIASHIHGLGLPGCLPIRMSMNITVYVACAKHIVAKTV